MRSIVSCPITATWRGGQMIDASIVHALKQSFSKEGKALVRDGSMLVDWAPAKRRQKCTDAR